MASTIRRSRGYAPQAIKLLTPCREPILAVGGQLKATFALARGSNAIVSHHLGDLDHLAAYRAFERDIALYEQLFDIRPRFIVHDLHPDYASTHYATKRAATEGIVPIAVQHHHAHMASCMAEHGIDEPIIGVSFDGTGYGADGSIWGGEFLIGDLRSFQRAAHLRYVAMTGADKAVKEPWRMAVAYLMDADCACSALQKRIEPQALRIVQQMLQKRFNAPLTSSCGRLFDAVASIVGIRDRVSFEGQAAMQLEWLAHQVSDRRIYCFAIVPVPQSESSACFELDTRPLIRAIVHDVELATPLAVISRRFHNTIAQLVVDTCVKLRDIHGLTKVALSGGVFMNATLLLEITSRLTDYGFLPLNQSIVPVNDGGISLGQIAIAARRIGANVNVSGDSW